MKSKKTFDCVEMKAKIQEKIDKEYSGLDDREKYKKIFDKIRKNPILSRLVANKYYT